MHLANLALYCAVHLRLDLLVGSKFNLRCTAQYNARFARYVVRYLLGLL
jgi:hypothetical protein